MEYWKTLRKRRIASTSHLYIIRRANKISARAHFKPACTQTRDREKEMIVLNGNSVEWDGEGRRIRLRWRLAVYLKILTISLFSCNSCF